MVSPIGPASGSPHAHAPMKAKAPASPEESAPGKSGDSVGHRAKMAISQAGESADLPKNIQGKVASALARGLSIEALLSIQDSADITEIPQDPEIVAEPAAAPSDPVEPLPDPVEPLPDPVEPLPDPVDITDLTDGETEPVAAEPEQAADTIDGPTDSPA